MDKTQSDKDPLGPDPVGQGPAGSSDRSLDCFLAAIERRAYRFAEISLGNREDALDALQDSMMKLMVYTDRPAAEWTPLFWNILRNRIIDVQRRRTFRLRWLSPAASEQVDPDWADGAPEPDRAHAGREAYGHLVAALRELPRRQREAFTLRVLEDLGVGATAQAMGCSQGSVKTHLSRARTALQEKLEAWR